MSGNGGGDDDFGVKAPSPPGRGGETVCSRCFSSLSVSSPGLFRGDLRTFFTVFSGEEGEEGGYCIIST